MDSASYSVHIIDKQSYTNYGGSIPSSLLSPIQIAITCTSPLIRNPMHSETISDLVLYVSP